MKYKKNLDIATLSVVSAIFFMLFFTLTYISYLHLIFENCETLFFILTIISFTVTTISGIQTIRNNEEQKKPDKKFKRKIITHITILTVLFAMFIAISKFRYCYGVVDAEQIFYHTFVSSAGMDFSTVITISVPTLICTTVFLLTLVYINYILKVKQKINKSTIKILSFASVISFILVITMIFTTIPILQFLYYQNFTESSFITNNYADPKTTKIEFPEQKRNLIYIYMESTENTFADYENGGAFKDNLIPEITNLQKENINFSNNTNIGGAPSTYGITYTTASIFSQSFGLPLKIGTNAKPMPNAILPNKYNIFDILNDAGYSQHIVMGSDVNFGGLKELFTSHGNVEIYDYQDMIKTGFIDKDYRVFWGVEDKLMYEYSKQKLGEISQKDEPFFFVMETVDTHNPNGYLCSECRNVFSSQYANVVSCASRQLNNFVNWAKEQSWYDNTTIVVVGDHLSMKYDFFHDIPKNYIRTTTNIIINPHPSLDFSNSNFSNRQFANLDMLPTTLASIGCKIEGDMLGLGTNLFSTKETIFEKYGYEYVEEEFKKKTTFYKNIFEG